MKALLTYAPMLARVRGGIALSLLLSLITLAAGIALLGVSGWFLTAAALTTIGSAFNIFGPSSAVRGFSFIRILSRYGEKLSGHGVTLRLLSDLRQWLFARLLPIAPLSRRFGRSDLVSRLIADIDALDTLFLLALGPITTALLAGLAMTTALALFLPGAAWAYGIATFVAVVVMPVVLVVASRRAGAAVLDASATLRRVTLDSIDGHQDLVLFGAIPQAEADANAAAATLGAAKFRLGLVGAAASGAQQLLAGIAITGTLIFGLEALRGGVLDGPLLAGLVLAVAASFEASALLVRSATRLATASAAAERLSDVVSEQPSVIETPNPVDVPHNNEITFNAVRFGYDPDHPVLRDIAFTIRDGARTAIVGPSGSGKSTIAQLLVRLIDPQAGAITLGGTDIRQFGIDALRRRITLMTQDAPVFLDTIRNNLLIGNPHATEPQMQQALDRVGLTALVASMPDRLDTIVGEAGRTLSAGEARRLCLARSLLSPAEVIVLDEPTTGLDAEAEQAFLADLPQMTPGRTVIVVTHAALPEGVFDAILTVRAGRLVSARRELLLA